MLSLKLATIIGNIFATTPVFYTFDCTFLGNDYYTARHLDEQADAFVEAAVEALKDKEIPLACSYFDRGIQSLDVTIQYYAACGYTSSITMETRLRHLREWRGERCS